MILRDLVYQPRNKAQTQAQQKSADATWMILRGPTGTGKTTCAFAMALQWLNEGRIDTIYLSRPLISVEEDLGYLPGSIEEKVGPWLEPFRDVLGSVSNVKLGSLAKRIQFASVGMLEGRTFRRSVLIIDEAHNATYKQLCSALTRPDEMTGKIILCGYGSDNHLGIKKSPLDYLVEKVPPALPGWHVIDFTEQDQIRSQRVRELLKYL